MIEMTKSISVINISQPPTKQFKNLRFSDQLETIETDSLEIDLEFGPSDESLSASDESLQVKFQFI